MATSKPKKPTLKKLPKRPKANASLAVWEKYEERCKEIQKENRNRLKAYEKELKAYEANKKKKAEIMKKTAQLGRL